MDLSIRSLYDQIPFGIFVWRLMSNFFDCCFMKVVFIETDISTRKETLTLKLSQQKEERNTGELNYTQNFKNKSLSRSLRIKLRKIESKLFKFSTNRYVSCAARVIIILYIARSRRGIKFM